jgi:MerR family transcriptional regulator, light-induced transcriptional regulator
VSRSEPDLTIGAVADQTDVSVAVLRSWEQRHGFPVPVRLPSGHRRYTADHVEQIRQVVRDRDAGMSLDAAIARVMAQTDRVEPSIFAGLRRRWPDLPVHLLSKRVMLAISRAIEDECCAQADRPVLIGSFQRQRFFGQSEARWRELARTATAAVVFADFPADRVRRRGLVELGLADDAPLRREWAVVCDAPDAAACLAGFERPEIRPGGPRQFEAVWSVSPAVVRDAATIGAALARQRDPAIELSLDAQPSTDFAAVLRRATAVTNRIVAYIDT